MTADLLELFFTSTRGSDSADVWTARRASATDPFQAPSLVTEVSSSSFDTSPAVTLDGLSLYFGSDRDGGAGEVDIWLATRPDRNTAWSDVQDVASLNSTSKDIPRPPGQHNLVMPMASERDSGGEYETYLAARATVGQPFDAPALVSGLAAADVAIADGFLTDDGLWLFCSATPPNEAPDLFVAQRASTADSFSLPLPLGELDTSADERDPWLSPDGTSFYFSSDRTGSLQIYEVSATRTAP